MNAVSIRLLSKHKKKIFWTPNFLFIYFFIYSDCIMPFKIFTPDQTFETKHV